MVVTEEIIDNNNSTKRCVTYMSNKPDKYDTACLSSFYTDGGTFLRCVIYFGDEKCNSCHVCETSDKQVGYDIDCYNAKPSENTEDCALLYLVTRTARACWSKKSLSPFGRELRLHR